MPRAGVWIQQGTINWPAQVTCAVSVPCPPGAPQGFQTLVIPLCTLQFVLKNSPLKPAQLSADSWQCGLSNGTLQVSIALKVQNTHQSAQAAIGGLRMHMLKQWPDTVSCQGCLVSSIARGIYKYKAHTAN